MYYKINARFRNRVLTFGVNCEEKYVEESVVTFITNRFKDSTIRASEISYSKSEISKGEFEAISNIEKVEA